LSEQTRSDELDDLYDALSNSRRRAVLHYLKQRDEESAVDISELSRVLVAWEQNVTREQVAYDDRHSVHTSLRQFHLPKMEESNLVEINPQGTAVELTTLADGLDIYVEPVTENDAPWSTYFVGLSVVSGFLLSIASVGVWPLATLSGLQISVVVVVTFVISSLAFAYDQRRHRIGAGDHPPIPDEGRPDG
jgi:DNA-binding transcriptional ArsR family regulator